MNNKSSYFVNGNAYKKKNIEVGAYELEVPYFFQISNDCKITHGRNAFIKNQLFYCIKKDTTSKGIQSYCLRLKDDDQSF